MSELTLAALFTDEMVLQRGRPNPIWGFDRPGQIVTLTVEGPATTLAPASATTSPEGSFRLTCPELPAGGPYRLRVRGSRELVIENVLVGEVWLASGQSNMEWKVAQAADASREIAEAKWPEIRMFTVGRQVGREPLRLATGGWRASHPDTVHDFSAVGYFFARELYRELKVPIGIIDASWGGTRVEAWTSLPALKGVMDVDRELEAWSLSDDAVAPIKRQYDAALAAWERENLPADVGNLGERQGWSAADHDDGKWPSMRLPGAWQGRGMAFNGVVWFRKTVELPPAWAGHDLLLGLGAIDDFDHTYFNGTLVGAHPKGTPGAYQIRRVYRVPAALVRPGKNMVAVRVFDHFGEGGLLGPSIEMYLETKGPAALRVPLAGAWRYAVEREIPLVSGDVFQTCPAPPPVLVPQDAPGALFCGMIAPLVPFGLRGVIWYQGERNTEEHGHYASRFLAMIRDWRAHFGQGEIPFYFVQLPNFVASPAWAHLREAQADVLSEAATGLAVAIDIGEPNDIHPRNKQEVGRRLSLLALARTYGRRDLEDSGPMLERLEIREGKVHAHFARAAGLRARGDGSLSGFTVAGADGVHHAARARVAGNTVELESPRVAAPLHVRYAWADNPDANLENAAGLPATPFRTDRA